MVERLCVIWLKILKLYVYIFIQNVKRELPIAEEN